MPQSTAPPKDDTPSGNTYRGLFVPSQAAEAFGKLVAGQGGRTENEEGGMLLGTGDNRDYVSDRFASKSTIKQIFME